MPPDPESSLLPKPPPPRPASRETAIEAALQRYDGGPDASSTRDQRRPQTPAGWWARSRQPQFAMAMSIALIAAIGVPATWIAVRNGALNPRSESQPPTATATEPRRSTPPNVQPDSAAQSSAALEAATVTTGEPEAPTSPLQAPAQDSKSTPVVANEATSEVRAAPPTVATAPAPAPPPPPPPPPAPQVAEKAAQGAVAEDLVVTGSRVRRPDLSAESGFLSRDASRAPGRAEAADAQTAPGWVLKDRSYAAFLTQLQTAVRTGDRAAVIRLVAFPLRVNSKGKTRLYRDAKSVRTDYDRIFTPRVTRAILDQRFDRLFGRDQGVMIGDGELWFDHSCTNAQCSPPGPVRITAVSR